MLKEYQIMKQKMYKILLESKIGWLECNFFTFKRENYILKSLNKIQPQSPKEK